VKTLVIGGGMITHDQILPSLYQLQREGPVGEITVCARHEETLAALRDSETIRAAFPERNFHASTARYLDLIAALPPRQLVIVALPDQLHFHAVTAALRHQQHVLCVKPLVLSARESEEIERQAFAEGLLVAVEYHKRLDDRSLMARRRYRAGWFGEFRLGSATLMEKWYYRHSNFQNWCTADNSDSFTYIGCHYVDLVHFITGLLPASVSVYGIRDSFPNGNEGYLWSDARVIWENGACLNVQNSLSFPDDGPGTNTQGLTLYCSDGKKGALLRHSDQYRGLEYSYTVTPTGPGATTYAEPSPDYFQYVPAGAGDLIPVGYGYRSIAAIVRGVQRVESAGPLALRQSTLRDIDAEGLLATPANSRFNELVVEAGRLSLLNGAREAVIDYEQLQVALR
jgi:D-galacturonate reductase